MLLLISSGPMVLRLGTRYAAWLERVNANGNGRGTARLAQAKPARIASVAVVDDELLVQLVAVDAVHGVGPGQVTYWLNARSEAITIAATERCCAKRSLVHYRATDSALVLVDVGDQIVPMLGLEAGADPTI